MSEIIYGAITPTDKRVLESVLIQFTGKLLNYLEVGVYEAATSAGVVEFCQRNGVHQRMFGIDVAIPESASKVTWENLVMLPSEVAWINVPAGMDVVVVDGCHCLYHVVLDITHYSPKVAPGGFMVFHDTAPQVQHVQKNPWVHPNVDDPITKTAVCDALTLMNWPNGEWKLWAEAHDDVSDRGGMMVFQKQ